MADYISRDKAAKVLCMACGNAACDPFECSFYKSMEDIPAADVRPVVRGNWLPYEFGDYHWHKCSVCGVADKFIETVYRKGFIDTELFSVRNFCPHCGADMRGDHGNGNKT